MDYAAIDPGNPRDRGLQYVRQEGHVGVEPAGRLRRRWRRFFEDLSIENALVYPFYAIPTYLADTGLDETFRSIIERFSPEERLAAHVCLGYVCEHFQNLARRACPELLMPADTPLNQDEPAPLSGGDDPGAAAGVRDQAILNLASRIFRKPCGLVYMTCRKPLAE
jgi:hypothetical protein